MTPTLRDSILAILMDHRQALSPKELTALEVMTRLLPAAVDERDSLTLADVYRIRISKFIAKMLPPEDYRDRRVQVAIRHRIRLLVTRELSDDKPSKYLD